MSEDEFIVMCFTIFGLGLIVVWQFFSKWRLKRKIRSLEAQLIKVATAPVPLMQPTHSPAREAEFDELRKRVQVLERIATDGNPVLEREIEDLRRAG